MPIDDDTGIGCSKENWGSKMGVILAVAGSAVGLGNFLRFPGQAVNNGGGAFMIPYIISFLLLGIPIAWCEWTMGRMGGRMNQNSAPGIMYSIWPKAPAKGLGAMALLIPVVIYMYYVMLEAWCLDYCIEFARGGFAKMFASATVNVADHASEVSAVVAKTGAHFSRTCGLERHGQLFTGNSSMLWLMLVCFLVNFVIIYQGVTRGIEKFCKWAMPALIICACVILIRVLTLPNIGSGLGFMWNPDWVKLKDPSVWLAASGQIFFSLSVGFGLILCYASYVRSDQDVALSSLSASSTNEFCEVILAGLIVVPTAFLFLGAENAKGSTFGLGFITIPGIMHFMPGGGFFGAVWFGLLFIAAVTSSLSMLQPAIAFLEDGFGLRRRQSVAILGVVTLIGAAPIAYFTKGALALDHTDFWCNLLMIVAATCQVLVFGWVVGAERGVKELNRGSDLPIPSFVAIIIRFVTPAFLIIILIAWSYQTLPGYLSGMNPVAQQSKAEAAVYTAAIAEHFAEQDLTTEQLDAKTKEILAPLIEEDTLEIDLAKLPSWLAQHQEDAARAGNKAAEDATIARLVLAGIIIFYILLVALTDLACRGRIGRTIREAELGQESKEAEA